MDYYKKYLKYKEKYLKLKKQIGGALMFTHENDYKRLVVYDGDNISERLRLQYDLGDFFRYEGAEVPIQAIFFNGYISSFLIDLGEDQNPINIDNILQLDDNAKNKLKEMINFMDERVNATLNNDAIIVHAMNRLKSITNRL